MQPGSFRIVSVYEFAALAVAAVALSALGASCAGGVEDFVQPLVAPQIPRHTDELHAEGLLHVHAGDP